jgi:hypothetical protein
MTAFNVLASSMSALLAGLALSVAATPTQASWNSGNPTGTRQCKSVDINDADIELINCLRGNIRVAFARQADGEPIALPPLAATADGLPCTADSISNAAMETAVIVGACRDADKRWQAVAWIMRIPAAAPVRLAPLQKNAGASTGSSTHAEAVNRAGLIAGESTDDDGNDTAVFWSASGAATALPLPTSPGSSQVHCEVAGLSDATRAQIVGNCSGHVRGVDAPVAVLWMSTDRPFIALPVPAGAAYCTVTQINLRQQMLGGCVYGPDDYRVVQWGAGGSGPTEMMAVRDVPGLPRSIGVSMNDQGLIAGTYLSQRGATGLAQTFVWNPAGGNAVGTAIRPAANGSNGVPRVLGNNGAIAGNYFAASLGGVHPFLVDTDTTTATDQGVCSGGINATVAALSRSGRFEAGSCISASGDSTGASRRLP